MLLRPTLNFIDDLLLFQPFKGSVDFLFGIFFMICLIQKFNQFFVFNPRLIYQ